MTARLSGLTLSKLLSRSIRHRRGRNLSAFLAFTVSAAVATCLLTLYHDLNQKLHREFRAFGANVIVSTADGSALPPEAMVNAAQIAGPTAEIVPWAYVAATTPSGDPIVVAGSDLDAAERMNRWWKTTSTAESSQTLAASAAPDQSLVAPAAKMLAGAHARTTLITGGAATLAYAGRVETFPIVATLATGGPEDDRLLMDLAHFEAWTGRGASTLELRVPGSSKEVADVIAQLAHTFPGLDVHAVRQLVEGENHIVDRTHSLMLASLALITLTVTVSVLATLTASVLERRKDYAIMKALGGSHVWLSLLFLFETSALAAVAAIAGYVLGSLTTLLIGELNFHAIMEPSLGVFLPALLINLVVAAVAALAPLRVLRNLEPAYLLKGD